MTCQISPWKSIESAPRDGVARFASAAAPRYAKRRMIMENVFTLVGVVSALLVCGGVCAAGIGVVISNWDDNNYRGLRSQISDTIESLQEEYESHETMESCDVRRILVNLNQRHWPRISDIKANQKLREQRRHNVAIDDEVSI